MTSSNAVGADLGPRFYCAICDHIYDPTLGEPEHGVPAGTPFSALPDDWECPDCGALKADFAPIAG